MWNKKLNDAILAGTAMSVACGAEALISKRNELSASQYRRYWERYNSGEVDFLLDIHGNLTVVPLNFSFDMTG